MLGVPRLVRRCVGGLRFSSGDGGALTPRFERGLLRGPEKGSPFSFSFLTTLCVFLSSCFSCMEAQE